MAVAAAPQTALDEQVIENTELEAVLEDREFAKTKAGAAKKDYKVKDDSAKSELAKLGLEDGAIARCGRFRIKKSAVPSRAVSFETSPTSRLTIGVLAEDE